MLLRKLYELNRQGTANMQFPPSMFAHPPPLIPNLPPGSVGAGVQFPGQPFPHPLSAASSSQPTPASTSGATMASSTNNMNNSSYLVDTINQSMMNNLSFQSEQRTPFNTSSMPPNLNLTSSSVPSSASALQQQQKQALNQQNLLKQSIQFNLQQQQVANPPKQTNAPVTSSAQQPAPSIFNIGKTANPTGLAKFYFYST